jgi:hypothetical protein
MNAKDVIKQLAGDLAETLDVAGLADDVRERVTEQLLSGASVQELADSIVSGVELLVKMAA